MIRRGCLAAFRIACRWAPLGVDPVWRERMVSDFAERLAEAALAGLLSVLGHTGAALPDLAS